MGVKCISIGYVKIGEAVISPTAECWGADNDLCIDTSKCSESNGRICCEGVLVAERKGVTGYARICVEKTLLEREGYTPLWAR